MAYYKKKKFNGKWYPRAVTIGRAATTDEVAEILSRRSTVSKADTYAVLTDLGEVMGELMATGRSVKLKGMGTFYLNCRTRGKGKDTPEEVTPSMITDVNVSFIPEYERNSRGEVIKRPMIDRFLKWTDLDKD